jgi:tRNA nucleotidyltransferase (CCA-adding enzyme)
MTISPRKTSFSLQISPNLKEAIALLKERGATCRLVGGCVRDALLGQKPNDFDVEVYGLELDTIANTLQTIGRTDRVGKSFAVVKLWRHGSEYDFSVPRTESKSGTGHRGFEIHPDISLDEKTALRRRDFTINALLYDPDKEVIIDYYGGQADLKNGILRHVSDAFSEDPLRVLRAVQFAGRFGLKLHPDTAELCKQMKSEYSTLALERIWGEWRKWAEKSRIPSMGMVALKESGWIAFFPEINALLRLPQDPEWHPEGDVFTHTLHCLDALVEKTDWKDLDESLRTTLIFGTLCHDLGKSRQTRFAEKGGKLRWISPGHDQDSGWLSESLLKRIGAPIAIAGKVRKLAENHHFLNSFKDGPPSDSSLRRLSRRIYPATTNELHYVMRSDHLGRPPLVSPEQKKRLADYSNRIAELAVNDSAPKPILLGRHLIEIGLKPGILFKEILSLAYEAQLDGFFESSEEAINWIRENKLV